MSPTFDIEFLIVFILTPFNTMSLPFTYVMKGKLPKVESATDSVANSFE
jgi:hypothetical protein